MRIDGLQTGNLWPLCCCHGERWHATFPADKKALLWGPHRFTSVCLWRNRFSSGFLFLFSYFTFSNSSAFCWSSHLAFFSFFLSFPMLFKTRFLILSTLLPFLTPYISHLWLSLFYPLSQRGARDLTCQPSFTGIWCEIDLTESPAAAVNLGRRAAD